MQKGRLWFCLQARRVWNRVPTNRSTGITDNSEKTTMQSYMLLKSELKGYIENIDWYFNNKVSLSERMQRADILMQTHGWRYYDTEKILQGKTVPLCREDY